LPKVSVIIPTYNAALTLARAVDSALRQAGCELDVVVIDDGSSDQTSSVLERYRTQVRVIRQANRGVASARNAGIEAAQGDFLAFLDSDDEWLPGKLEKQLALFVEEPELDVVYCGAIYVTTEGQPRPASPVYLRGPAVLSRLAFGNFVTTSSVVARSACFRNSAMRFPNDLKLGEDYAMWLRLASCGRKFAPVPEAMVRYLVGGNPAKYPAAEYRRFFDHLERIILDADALARPEREKLLQRRRVAGRWDLAVFYAQQRQWLPAARDAARAWSADPSNLRGIAHFLWHGVARRR
jgi:glycosyltransferase involved in cell wall biosynthesis